jgi:hypothetical protein
VPRIRLPGLRWQSESLRHSRGMPPRLCINE